VVNYSADHCPLAEAILDYTMCIYCMLKQFIRFCYNNEWHLPPVVNCSADHCPLVEAILDYARDNLVMFNIFIKVSFSLDHRIFDYSQLKIIYGKSDISMTANCFACSYVLVARK